MTLSITRAVLVLAAIAAAKAQSPAGIAIGAAAPDFSQPGVDGKLHTMKEYAGAKVLAVFFMCNSCPAAQLSEGSIAEIYRELSYTDVTDSLDDMKIRAEFRHIEYPYLYDGDTQAQIVSVEKLRTIIKEFVAQHGGP